MGRPTTRTRATAPARSAAATASLSHQVLTGWECASCGCALSMASTAWWTHLSTCGSETGGNASSGSSAMPAMPASVKFRSGHWLVVRHGARDYARHYVIARVIRPGWVAEARWPGQGHSSSGPSHAGGGGRWTAAALAVGSGVGRCGPVAGSFSCKVGGLLVLEGARGWGWQGRVICPAYPVSRWRVTDLWA